VPSLGDKIFKILFRLKSSFFRRPNDGVKRGDGVGPINRFTSGEVFSSEHAMTKRAFGGVGGERTASPSVGN
jgi:hypothetical protein